MSSTTTRGDTTLAPEPESAPGQGISPPKLRRQPALVAGAVVAICLGAILAAWAWTSTTDTQEILVARHTIERGSLIDADDLARVHVSVDPALNPVAAASFDRVVGKRAALDIAGGGILTPSSFTSTMVPKSGYSVVGVALAPGQAPGLDLRYGDHVRVVVTPARGEDLPAGAPPFSEATVVGVHVSQTTGKTVVDLLVPHAQAPVLAARVATGNIAIVLDSRER